MTVISKKLLLAVCWLPILTGCTSKRIAVAIVSAVATTSPLATDGPVPGTVAGTCRHARPACGDACPIVVRKYRS